MISTSPSHRDDDISQNCDRDVSMTDFETHVSTNVARSTCTKTYPYEYKLFIQELIYLPLLCIEIRNDKPLYIYIDI